MLGNKGGDKPVESTALVAAIANASQSYSNQRSMDEKPQVWCDYCNKPHQTQETCWKIRRKPAN